MGKPLLTDEMIERANRGEAISGPPLFDEEETKILPTGNRGFGYERPVTSGEGDSGHGASYPQETIPIRVQPTVTKSRRIENQCGHATRIKNLSGSFAERRETPSPRKGLLHRVDWSP